MSAISKIGQVIRPNKMNSIKFKGKNPLTLPLQCRKTIISNAEGKRLKETIEERGGYKTVNKYIYDENGNLIKRITTRVFDRNKTAKDEFEYDKNQNIVSRKTQYQTGVNADTVSLYLSGGATMQYDSTYDDNGRCNECKYKVIDKYGDEIKLPVHEGLSQEELIEAITSSPGHKDAISAAKPSEAYISEFYKK